MRSSHGVALAILLWLPAGAADELPPLEQFLAASAVGKEVIDRFLRGPSWAQFDPELGYIAGSYLPADGIDKSSTITTVQPNGARTSFVYATRKCRQVGS